MSAHISQPVPWHLVLTSCVDVDELLPPFYIFTCRCNFKFANFNRLLLFFCLAHIQGICVCVCVCRHNTLRLSALIKHLKPDCHVSDEQRKISHLQRASEDFVFPPACFPMGWHESDQAACRLGLTGLNSSGLWLNTELPGVWLGAWVGYGRLRYPARTCGDTGLPVPSDSVGTRSGHLCNLHLQGQKQQWVTGAVNVWAAN